MIGKITKGGNAAGLLAYVSAAQDAQGRERESVAALGGTIAGETTAEQVAHFQMLADQRPAVATTVSHLMLRWTAADPPSLAEQALMAELHATSLGYQHYCVFSHGDHLHIAASRINSDGSVVNDSWDWKRAEQSIRALELKFGLVQVESSHLLDPSKRDNHRASPSAGELGAAGRDQPSVRLQLQEAVDAAVSGGATFFDFVARLQCAGVEVRPNLQSTGRVAGLSFILDGVEMRGAALGKAYSWGRLQKRGLNYDEKGDRDVARECVSRCEAARNPGGDGRIARTDGRDHGRSHGRDREPGRDNHTGGTVNRAADYGSPEHAGCFEPRGKIVAERGSDDRRESAIVSLSGGETDRRKLGEKGYEPDLPRDRRQQSGQVGVELRDASRSTAASKSSAGGNIDRSDRRGAVVADRPRHRTGRGHVARTTAVGASAPVVIPGDATPEEALRLWADGERRKLDALAALQAELDAPVRAPAMSPFSSSPSLRRLTALAGVVVKSDPTADQVRRQVQAFACPAFEVGIIPPKHRADLKPERTRRFTAAQLTENRTIAWLKRMNTLDRDIFVRPAALDDERRSPLVFVDDLSADQVAQMKSAGLPLAIEVESSPGRFHGWCRVAGDPITRAEAQHLARELSRRFGGDPGAASWNQYGRLAGFTNRKKERRSERRGAPFAKLHASTGDIAPAGPKLLSEVRATLQQQDQNVRAAQNEQYRRARRAEDLQRAAVYLGGARYLASAAEAFRAARSRADVRRADDGSRDESRADFAAAALMLEQGWEPAHAEAAILEASPNVYERHPDAGQYARRTVDAARRRIAVARPKNSRLPALRR
ncbi:DNA-primase RepB domain-containing protein [Bradyrhizobium prioriisuperbiae]|uniref:DNA-primase RepB domain-containing protein n=1 Tax=Bradyrhizobium prioriisuperbiae TaxID=2854389 RepID=UPI0028E3DB3F|nr:DNA-primase RepB domain-containing protein [Bradyrhizobium prioritasuperba]